jgi:hypothetical protein
MEVAMPRTVIVAYKPKTGMSAKLDACVAKHWRMLREQKLVTERPAFTMKAVNGTTVEVFEWLSKAAIEAAHTNAAVQALWDEFGACCDFLPIAQVPEAAEMFSEFETVSLAR